MQTSRPLVHYDGPIEWINEGRVILYGIHGSHLYGTNIETSDEDYKGIVVPPRVYRQGFSKTFEQVIQEGCELEYVIYDIRKFFKLGVKCNPNILELLYSKSFLHSTEGGRLLAENRDAFLSQRAISSYNGYALSQLKKMETYRAANPERARLRELYGYDTKFAMHLIRLLRVCNEMLTEGTINVFRKDAEQLIEIRRGGWSLARVHKVVQDLEARNSALATTTSLPKEPDIDFLESLMSDIIEITECSVASKDEINVF
jgi:uncharacterized protein